MSVFRDPNRALRAEPAGPLPSGPLWNTGWQAPRAILAFLPVAFACLGVPVGAFVRWQAVRQVSVGPDPLRQIAVAGLAEPLASLPLWLGLGGLTVGLVLGVVAHFALRHITVLKTLVLPHGVKPERFIGWTGGAVRIRGADFELRARKTWSTRRDTVVIWRKANAKLGVVASDSGLAIGNATNLREVFREVLRVSHRGGRTVHLAIREGEARLVVHGTALPKPEALRQVLDTAVSRLESALLASSEPVGLNDEAFQRARVLDLEPLASIRLLRRLERPWAREDARNGAGAFAPPGPASEEDIEHMVLAGGGPPERAPGIQEKDDSNLMSRGILDLSRVLAWLMMLWGIVVVGEVLHPTWAMNRLEALGMLASVMLMGVPSVVEALLFASRARHEGDR